MKIKRIVQNIYYPFHKIENYVRCNIFNNTTWTKRDNFMQSLIYFKKWGGEYNPSGYSKVTFEFTITEDTNWDNYKHLSDWNNLILKQKEEQEFQQEHFQTLSHRYNVGYTDIKDLYNAHNYESYVMFEIETFIKRPLNTYLLLNKLQEIRYFTIHEGE